MPTAVPALRQHPLTASAVNDAAPRRVQHDATCLIEQVAFVFVGAAGQASRLLSACAFCYNGRYSRVTKRSVQVFSSTDAGRSRQDDGLPVSDPKLLARRPLFIVVNNDPQARTEHYGFAEAELVYEYVMEGLAVTRYTLVFLAAESERIGPVRSARLVNFYLTPQYGGALVASGAGNDVRWWLKHKMPAPYLDIDLDDPGNNIYAFTVGANYMTRMQTSTARLRKWLADWKV